MITFTLIVIVLSLIAYLIKKAWDINQHWERKGIKHIKPVLFFGNCLPMILNKKSQNEIVEELYDKYPKETILGHKISPIFTSGKLKDMYTTMTSCGENLLNYLEQRKDEDIDIRELMGLFSMDVIGAAVFGMDPATLKNPDCEFRVMGRQLMENNILNILRFWFLFAFPKLSQILGVSFQNQAVGRYYRGLLQQNFNYRKENQVYRNDFTQMLLQLKEKGKVEVQSWDSNDDYLKIDAPVGNVEEFAITDDIIMAQAQSFMVAGFETTAVLMTFTLFELTQHSEMQDRIREEIFEQVKLHGGLTYEALRNMKYLEATVKETQRVYPMVPYLFRACTKEYELPNGYVIKKGDSVAIPITAVHMDPNNYPDPKKFNPERFLEPIKQGIFLPFGEGPRICIAMRYAIMVMKYGLAKCLMTYRVSLSENTKVPLEFNKRFFSIFPKKKILLKIEKLKI